jgi:hypothetical protein
VLVKRTDHDTNARPSFEKHQARALQRPKCQKQLERRARAVRRAADAQIAMMLRYRHLVALLSKGLAARTAPRNFD